MHVAESTYTWPTSMYHGKHSASDMDACDCGFFVCFEYTNSTYEKKYTLRQNICLNEHLSFVYVTK